MSTPVAVGPAIADSRNPEQVPQISPPQKREALPLRIRHDDESFKQYFDWCEAEGRRCANLPEFKGASADDIAGFLAAAMCQKLKSEPEALQTVNVNTAPGAYHLFDVSLNIKNNHRVEFADLAREHFCR